MALTTGNLSNYLQGVAKITETGLTNRIKNAIYPQIVSVSSTGKIDERVQDVESFGAVAAWPEGSPRPGFDWQEGWAQKMSQHQFGGVVDITKPMVKFSQENLVKKATTKLMDGCVISLEAQAAAYLEYGATAIASVLKVGGRPIINSIGGDGVTLFNAAHPWRSGGGTWGNLSTASLDLTETTINTVATQIARWLDNAGVPLSIEGKRLVIPSEYIQKAEKLTRSEKEPSTANNAVNTYSALMRGGYLVWKYLSDTGDWYVETTASDDCAIQFFFGWKPEVDTASPHPRTGNRCVGIDYSIAHGCNVPLRYYKSA